MLPFRIKRDGTWLYQDKPVRRKAMLCLFASLLQRDDLGRYWLDMPGQRGVIAVDDVPFLAVALDFRGKSPKTQTLCLRTNMDELVCVGPRHPLVCDWQHEEQAVPYLDLGRKKGAVPLYARISRPVMFELAALATQEQVNGVACMGVWSQGCFFPLQKLAAGSVQGNAW